MEKSLEESLLQALLTDDQEKVLNLLSKGANPNKTVSHGKTCLGEAANLGNIEILKLLIDASKASTACGLTPNLRKKSNKCHKRKNKIDVKQKYKGYIEKGLTEYHHYESFGFIDKNGPSDRNQGYVVLIQSDGSSSDDSRICGIRSPLSPVPPSPSPQADLEWDEEIGNVAPSTSEDESWTSMYKWYAAILECTGAAIASGAPDCNGIDQQDAFLRTALHYAAEQGHIGAVKVLVEADCKIDVAALDGLTALHIAAIKNHGEVATYLVDSGCQVNYRTHDKMSPLHFAASRGLLDLVKLLVKKGANIDARDTNERTPLYLAAGRGHIEVVKYLITVGANVNGEEIHVRLEAYNRRRTEKSEVSFVFRRTKQGYTPLCEAVWQRYADVAELLLTSGARITHSHKLLHNAIVQRQEKIVYLLANYGGGINLHNDNGDTPLLLASRMYQPRVVKVLLEKGANINSCNSITGANSLHVAVESVDAPDEFEEVLNCLLEYNIDMNATALTGDTPLNRALLLQKDLTAALLIRYGADVCACDLRVCGLDNMAIASRRPTHYLADMLIKAGHYTSIQDAYLAPGATGLWLAQACRSPRSLADLARIRIRTSCRNRPLYRYIDGLPLPSTMKAFLKMEHEGREIKSSASI